MKNLMRPIKGLTGFAYCVWAASTMLLIMPWCMAYTSFKQNSWPWEVVFDNFPDDDCTDPYVCCLHKDD